jgi:hypothetical protein
MERKRNGKGQFKKEEFNESTVSRSDIADINSLARLEEPPKAKEPSPLKKYKQSFINDIIQLIDVDIICVIVGILWVYLFCNVGEMFETIKNKYNIII